MSKSQSILDRLDKLLYYAPKHSGSFAEELSNDVDYIKGQEYYLNTTPRTIIEVNCLAETAAKIIDSGDFSGKPFRLCDIGCGGGVWDRLLLERLMAEFPGVEFQYLGVDINEAACQKARQEFDSLSKQVTWSVVCCDFENLATASFRNEKFDLVVTVHTLYYTNPAILPSVISNFLSLVKQNGQLAIVNCRKCSANDILRRMWVHENKPPLMYLSDIVKALSDMHLEYTCEKLDYFSDLTELFKDGFKSPLARAVLDFLNHSNLSSFSPEVGETCVEFLREACSGKPERYLLPVRQDAIVVTPRKPYAA